MSLESRKIRLVMELRTAGITDTQVLAAVERTPRELFVPQTFLDKSYHNQTLPIGHGQTISQPVVVARMPEALSVTDRHKVLEVGTGSGYQAAVLARLCRRLYTVERYRGLLTDAEARFHRLRLHNITARAGDGMKGWPEQAPFERIMVTAAAAGIPRRLAEQLAVGGVMVMPMELGPGDQQVVRITRTDAGYDTEALFPVKFVPLVPGEVEQG